MIAAALGRRLRGREGLPARAQPRADGALPALSAAQRRDASERRAGSVARIRRMKIWVDMSAPAHVLVLRPIIERLRAAGHEVEVTSRDYTQTQELLELHGMDAHADRPPRRRLAVRKLLRLLAAHGEDAAVRKGTRLRPRARPRLQRPRDRRPRARHPRGEHARLRVRRHPAPGRLPARQAGDVPGLGAAGAPAEVRGRAREAVPVSRVQGGVLPRGLRAGPRGARASSASTPSASWWSCGRHPTSRSTTASRTRCSPRCSRGSAASATSTRWSCRAPRRSASSSRGWRCPR